MSLFDFKTNWRKPVACIAVAGAVLAGFTMGWEGVVLETYKDPVGIKTIGVGHTGADVKDGMKITRKQAEEILIKDLQKHWDGIKGSIKVPLYEHEAMAYTDFSFNVGVNAFKKSTLLKKLNQGKYSEACAELKKWVYAGGKKLNGLVKRRDAEYKMCITKGVKPGMKITQEQSDHMTSYELTLRSAVLKSLIKVPIHQYEWDANMLLAWNIGIGNYAQSTVLKRLNKKQYKESCDAFLMWKYAGGKPILLKRRQRERLLCLGVIKKI